MTRNNARSLRETELFVPIIWSWIISWPWNLDLSSFKVIENSTVPFESFGTVSYSHSIVTMALPSALYHFRDKARSCSKIAIFFIPPAFDAPVRGSLSEYCHHVWCGNTRMVWLPDGVKGLMHRHKPACECDRRIDGRDRHLVTAKSALCIASRRIN